MKINWDIDTIVSLIEKGVILLPKFMALWQEISTTFSSDDRTVIDAALKAAIARDIADTAQADADLTAAAGRKP